MVKIQTSFSHGMIRHLGLFEIELLGYLPQQENSFLYEVKTSGDNKQSLKRTHKN